MLNLKHLKLKLLKNYLGNNKEIMELSIESIVDISRNLEYLDLNLSENWLGYKLKRKSIKDVSD